MLSYIIYSSGEIFLWRNLMGYRFKKFKYKILSCITIGKAREYYKKKNAKYNYNMYDKINDLESQINANTNHLGNIEYELVDKYNIKTDKIKIPKILSIEETIEEIINNKKSISRFGDGEFYFLLGEENLKQIYFKTDFSFELQEKLIQVIQSNLDNHLVCLWDNFGSLEKYTESGKAIARMHMLRFRNELNPYLDFNKTYGNAFISRPYINLQNKEISSHYFELIKKIWDKQDVVIIEGEGSRLGVGNDLFDNAKSIERVLCPSENAFSCYDEILDYAKTLPKNKLILIALGMTATILAYDLAKLGFWAIDIGHIDIEYEWYKQKTLLPVAVKNKYVNDESSRKFKDVNDEKYKSSIIKTISEKKENSEYTANDIDIFVLTYNRCEFLKESLKSLFNQTVKNINITVIDNASTDLTQEYLEKLTVENSFVHYHRNNENKGSEYSYNLAGMIAKRRLMMVFHDDDILHPKYIETALAYFNKYKNLNILSTDCHTPDVMSNDNWEEVSDKAVYCKNTKELASVMYYEGTFAYPAVVYRTKNYKNLQFNKEPYGKIDDKIRCLEISKGGSALVLKDKNFLRYRVHKGQDSSNSANGPYYNQIINFNRYFKKLLTSDFFSQDNLLFTLRNNEWFEFLYYWHNDNSISLKELIDNGYQQNAVCLFTKFLHKKGFRHLLKNIRHFLKKNLKPYRKIVRLK